ncbi:MAG TPA: type II toxin-antitoxin system Phd/YefM family antitoxin [Nitrospiraceae bacterium]|nr:type II toxin-antitoxin system Phd/YefM family antitoxin [Nitrospiraceae bacterium]
MDTVEIADLKSRLSEHLRKVRAGRSMTILDRDHPIARLVPIDKTGASLTVRPPLASAPKLQRVALPPPLRLRKDIFAFLNEERQGER